MVQLASQAAALWRNRRVDAGPLSRTCCRQTACSTYSADTDPDQKSARVDDPARTLRSALYRIDAMRKLELVALLENRG